MLPVFNEYLFTVETNGGSILSEPLLFESVKDRSFAAAIEAEHDHAVARHQWSRYPRSHGGGTDRRVVAMVIPSRRMVTNCLRWWPELRGRRGPGQLRTRGRGTQEVAGRGRAVRREEAAPLVPVIPSARGLF